MAGAACMVRTQLCMHVCMREQGMVCCRRVWLLPHALHFNATPVPGRTGSPIFQLRLRRFPRLSQTAFYALLRCRLGSVLRVTRNLRGLSLFVTHSCCYNFKQFLCPLPECSLGAISWMKSEHPEA
eukprot:1158828-Pelagomonas_calceolata.AAC.2